MIPVNPEATDGVNPWYPLAIATAGPHTLDNGIKIRLIDPVCFLGTKMAAFRSRTRKHHDDVFLSRDFGDMVRVIDGREALAAEVAAADSNLRTFLQQEFSRVLKSEYIEEAVVDQVETGRDSLVLKRMCELAGERSL